MPKFKMQRPDESAMLNNLAALVPVTLLQELQDRLSTSLGLPILFVSPEGGPITKSDSLDLFCWRFARQGRTASHCAECGRPEFGISEPDDPQPYSSPLGLTDIAMPIRAGELTVGYLLTSQITTEPGAPRALEAARGYGMSAAEAVKYASRIPMESPQRLIEIARTVAPIVKMLSELAASSRIVKLAKALDPLTGLSSRDYFWERLTQELESADAHNYPVSLLLIDLDNFKQINDTFGHETGDNILKTVGELLGSEIRSSDLVARYASDCFLLMLHATDSTGTGIVGWRLKNKIAACKITARGQRVPISATVVQVTYPDTAARDPDALFKELFSALQAAEPAVPTKERRKAA